MNNQLLLIHKTEYAAVDEIFVKIDENTVGPLSPNKIRNMVEQGIFEERHLVWSKVDGEWTPAGSVEALNPYFHPSQKKKSDCPQSNKIIAIASGKSGVGKSFFAGLLGVELAKTGYRTTLVSLDFSMENQRDLKKSSTDKSRLLRDFVVETSQEGLGLIRYSVSGVTDGQPEPDRQDQFLNELRKIDTEFVIVDPGDVASRSFAEIFLQADEPILLSSPELPVILESFAFLRSALLRRVQQLFPDEPQLAALLVDSVDRSSGAMVKTIAQIHAEVAANDMQLADRLQAALNSTKAQLILNQKNESRCEEEVQAIIYAARDLLSIRVRYGGAISFDEKIQSTCNQVQPIVLNADECQASQGVKQIFQSFFEEEKPNESTQSKAIVAEQIETVESRLLEVDLPEKIAVVDLVKSQSSKKKLSNLPS